MNSKRGSSTVLLVFILTAVIGVTALFIFAARQKAYTSISDGVICLAGRSILSEYDLTLKERYGLLAFEKTGMESALEINDYIDTTLEKEKPVKNISVSFGEYSLANSETLKKQIMDYMKTEGVQDIFSGEKDIKRTDITDRTLRNEALIESLPSKALTEDGFNLITKIKKLENSLETFDEVFDKGKDSYLINSYIINHFKYATGGPLNNQSFFENEVEYIICGNTSNKQNREVIEKGLILLRTGLNIAYIYTDEKKCGQTLAAAQILTPEAAPATQAILISTWAAVEAQNDVELLLNGRPVPVMKDDSSWATDLDSVLNNVSEDYIDTGNENGLYYSDYMMVLLFLVDENIKLARVADLIQINMKREQDKDFLMKTASGGMIIKADIYGRSREYEMCY